MKLLITGASGFIGKHILSLYKRNAIAIDAVSRQPGVDDDHVRWHNVDIFDHQGWQDLLEKTKPTHLLHLAWCAKPGEYWTSADNQRWLSSSLLLVREFFAGGGVRFVGAGSCAEYEWNGTACTENTTRLLPKSVYGASKCKLFEYLEQLNRGGASCAWGRVFWTYGPGEDRQRLVPYVINSLLKKEIARCSSGSQIRDYMHVADVALAFKTLIESDVTGAINIGSGQPLAVGDLVNLIATKLEAKQLVQFAADEAPREHLDIVYADVGKLAELGFKPHIDLHAGIAETIKWWQLNGAAS